VAIRQRGRFDYHMVSVAGLEPATSAFPTQHSTKLSYTLIEGLRVSKILKPILAYIGFITQLSQTDIRGDTQPESFPTPVDQP